MNSTIKPVFTTFTTYPGRLSNLRKVPGDSTSVCPSMGTNKNPHHLTIRYFTILTLAVLVFASWPEAYLDPLFVLLAHNHPFPKPEAGSRSSSRTFEEYVGLPGRRWGRGWGGTRIRCFRCPSLIRCLEEKSYGSGTRKTLVLGSYRSFLLSPRR